MALAKVAAVFETPLRCRAADCRRKRMAWQRDSISGLAVTEPATPGPSQACRWSILETTQLGVHGAR